MRKRPSSRQTMTMSRAIVIWSALPRREPTTGGGKGGAEPVRSHSPRNGKQLHLSGTGIDRETAVFTDGIVAHAVQRRGAVLAQSFDMLGGLIAFVASQAVLGEHGVPLAHHFVAINLGDDRR